MILEELDMSQDESFDDLAERMQQMQIRAREMAQKRNPTATLKRGFHAKGTGVQGRFKVNAEIQKNLQVDFIKPGAEYDALVRFSNARGEVLGDLSKDQRGIAIRLKTKPGESLSPGDKSDLQDFLMTNTPVTFARNPLQFIEVGEILLGGIGMVIPRLVNKYGFKEARRILGVFLVPIFSFTPYQMNTYWSRTSFHFGEAAVRFLVRPAAGSKIWSKGRQFLGVMRSLTQGAAQRENYLREKLKAALHGDELKFEFCIQLFVDDKKTPIEEAYIEWKKSDSPPIPIATLTLPKQDIDERLQQVMEEMAFSPWNTKELTPLGVINLARKKVYAASAIHRGGNIAFKRN
jgi:catalase